MKRTIIVICVYHQKMCYDIDQFVAKASFCNEHTGVCLMPGIHKLMTMTIRKMQKLVRCLFSQMKKKKKNTLLFMCRLMQNSFRISFSNLARSIARSLLTHFLSHSMHSDQMKWNPICMVWFGLFLLLLSLLLLLCNALAMFSDAEIVRYILMLSLYQRIHS